VTGLFEQDLASWVPERVWSGLGTVRSVNHSQIVSHRPRMSRFERIMLLFCLKLGCSQQGIVLVLFSRAGESFKNNSRDRIVRTGSR